MDSESLLSIIEQLVGKDLDISTYQYYHQLFDNRTIIFNDEVSEDIIEKAWLPLREFEEDYSDEPVTLILNSLGGSVSDGFFFANYLTHYKKKLNIIICGYAASMAMVILCAGGKNPNITRYCYPSTYGLIHDGYIALATSETQTASDILEYNKLVDQNIRDFIIANTNITPEQYDSKARKQWFLQASEMKDLNIIDHIYGEDDLNA